MRTLILIGIFLAMTALVIGPQMASGVPEPTNPVRVSSPLK